VWFIPACANCSHMLISTITLSIGCQTAGSRNPWGRREKKKTGLSVGGRAGGRHESAFGPEGLTRMLR